MRQTIEQGSRQALIADGLSRREAIAQRPIGRDRRRVAEVLDVRHVVAFRRDADPADGVDVGADAVDIHRPPARLPHHDFEGKLVGVPAHARGHERIGNDLNADRAVAGNGAGATGSRLRCRTRGSDQREESEGDSSHAALHVHQLDHCAGDSGAGVA